MNRENRFRPHSPPRRTSSLNWASVRFLGWPQQALTWEWDATKGRSAMFNRSSNPASLRWEQSTIMPTCSMRFIASFPKAVSPVSLFGPEPSSLAPFHTSPSILKFKSAKRFMLSKSPFNAAPLSMDRIKAHFPSSSIRSKSVIFSTSSAWPPVFLTWSSMYWW